MELGSGSTVPSKKRYCTSTESRWPMRWHRSSACSMSMGDLVRVRVRARVRVGVRVRVRVRVRVS